MSNLDRKDRDFHQNLVKTSLLSKMHAFMYTKTEVQDMLAMKRKPQPVLLKTLQDYEQSLYNE